MKKIAHLLLTVVADSSVEDVGPNPEPVMQSVSSSSHSPGTTSVNNDGGGTTVGGTYTGVIKSSPAGCDKFFGRLGHRYICVYIYISTTIRSLRDTRGANSVPSTFRTNSLVRLVFVRSSEPESKNDRRKARKRNYCPGRRDTSPLACRYDTTNLTDFASCRPNRN